MINATELKKKFGDLVVLNGINLKIEKGDIFGLVGRSGVGKSTLLRCMNGLEWYDSGSLTIDGKEISLLSDIELRMLRRKVGMIFQNFSLIERDTVYQNIVLPMKCWKVNKKLIDKKVDYLLEIVELSDKKYYKPRELSGGQKQRVAIARALAMELEVLLCDEATSALDPNTTHSILNLLKSLNQKLGLTIVLVTHQMSVVREICNKVAVLDQGKIADVGAVRDVFLNQSAALVELLGEGNAYKLPLTGVNIKFLFSNDFMENNSFSFLMRNINVSFDLIVANVFQYTTGNLGEFVINLKEMDVPLLIQTFRAHNIKWEILNYVE